jgi:hypothetical protein
VGLQNSRGVIISTKQLINRIKTITRRWLALLKARQSGLSAANGQQHRFVITGHVIHVFTACDTAMALFDIGIALAGINLCVHTGRRTAAFKIITDPPQTLLGDRSVITATIRLASAARH